MVTSAKNINARLDTDSLSAQNYFIFQDNAHKVAQNAYFKQNSSAEHQKNKVKSVNNPSRSQLIATLYPAFKAAFYLIYLI